MTVAIQWMRYVRAYARGINYWIATPSVMARNDKDDKIHITWILGASPRMTRECETLRPRMTGVCGGNPASQDDKRVRDPASQDGRCVW